MTSLRDLCLKDAVGLNRELMAEADRMVQEGVDRDELAHLFIKVATIQDRLIQALEPASDIELERESLLRLARAAALEEVEGVGC